MNPKTLLVQMESHKSVRAVRNACGKVGNLLLSPLRAAARRVPPPQPTLTEFLRGGRRPGLSL